MDSADLLGAGKIRDRARHSNYAVKAAGREPHRRRCVREQLASRLVGRRHALEQLAVGLCVRADSRSIVAIRLSLARDRDTAGDVHAAFRRRRKGEIGGGNPLNVHVKVDAIEKPVRKPAPE